MSDLISRQAEIDELADYIQNLSKVFSTALQTREQCVAVARIVLGEDEIPSVKQPYTDDEIQKMQDLELDVIAWCPLPEPHREEQHETD